MRERTGNRFPGMAPGAPPGTVAGDPNAQPPTVELFRYDSGSLDIVDVPLSELAATVAAPPPGTVSWFNIIGVSHAASLKAIGEVFQLHPLVLEDIANTYQRPKADPYGEQSFVVLRIPHRGEALETEQVSLVVAPGTVVTFQERAGDCFAPIRDRLRGGRVRLRGSGSDYLAYALIDAAIDSFFPVLEEYGEHLEELESAVLGAPDPRTLADIQRVKRDLLRLRRTLWPYRELTSGLSRDDAEAFQRETRVFLRDCHDHTIQLMDLVESYREIGSGLIDLHMSAVSNRMNDVMSTLTIIATVFIPLTFIAGIYGMNFDPAVSPWNMPELSWYWGYPMAWAMMLGVGGATLLYFRRKGWLGGGGSARYADEETRDDGTGKP